MKARRFLTLVLCLCIACSAFGTFKIGAQAGATAIIITQPESVTVGDGEYGSFKVVADNAATYQWQYYCNGWQQSSVTAAEYGFTGLMQYDGRRYRCIVTGTDGDTVTTDEVTLKVIPVTITKQPLAQKLRIGDTAYFDITAKYARSYQWQWSEDGGSTWKNGTTNTYTRFAAAAARNNRLYRCIVTGASSSVISDAVKLDCTTLIEDDYFTTLYSRKSSSDMYGTLQGMAMIDHNIYSSVLYGSNDDNYIYRTNINYPNSSKNLGQYNYLGHCNDICAFKYNGSSYLLCAEDHQTVHLVCVDNDEVVRVRSFNIASRSGSVFFGGMGLLNVEGSKVTLLLRDYPDEENGFWFGITGFDMANLPADNEKIIYRDYFVLSTESICSAVYDVLGYSACSVVGHGDDPGFFGNQSFAYDAADDRLYIPLMVCDKAKPSDTSTSLKYVVFVVYNGVTTRLAGKTGIEVDDAFGYMDNNVEVESAGFYNGQMYFAVNNNHKPYSWNNNCNFYVLPVKKEINGKIYAGIKAPEYNEAPYGADDVTTAAGYSCDSIVWTPDDGFFKPGTVYKAKVTLRADEGYSFDSNEVYMPGASAITDIECSTRTISFTAVFPETSGLVLTEDAIWEGYRLDGGGLCGFAAGTSVESAITHFKYGVTVKDKNGNIMTTGKIGTGCTVSCAGQTATALLRGDVDGDGEITVNDYMTVKAMFKTDSTVLDGVYKKMADVDDNGKYTVSDYLKIKRSADGTFEIKDDYLLSVQLRDYDDLSGGTGTTHTVMAAKGAKMPELDFDVPTKPGYVFMGYYWGTNGGGYKFYDEKLNPTSQTWNWDTNNYWLAAYWVPAHTVTLKDFDDLSGEAGTTHTVMAVKGSTMPELDFDIPTKPGYVFMGYYWNTNGAGSKFYDEKLNPTSQTFNWDSDTIWLAAYWVPAHTVTLRDFDDPDGGIGTTHTITVGQGVTMPELDFDIPTKPGYVFMGYYWGNNGYGNKFYDEKLNPTFQTWDWDTDSYWLAAYWVPAHTVQLRDFDDPDGGIGTTHTITVGKGATMPELDFDIPTKPGYVFNGYYWNTDGDGSKFYDSTLAPTSQTFNWDSDTIWLAAYWTPDGTRTVQLRDLDDDSLNGGAGHTHDITVTIGRTMPELDFEIPTRPGYVFRGYYWNTDGAGSKFYDENLDPTAVTWTASSDSCWLAAYWVPVHTVTLRDFDDPDGGIGTTHIITVGEGAKMPELDFDIPTKPGYIFMGYYWGNNGAGYKFYGGDLNPTSQTWNWNTDSYWLAAYWVPAHTVTLRDYDDLSGGIGTTHIITVGEGITMPDLDFAVPVKPGYIFRGYYWGTNGYGNQFYDENLAPTSQTWNWNTDSYWLAAYWEEE